MIGDEELIRKFGHMEPDPLIYGGSIIRENVKKFLRSPSKTKMYGKVRKLTEKIRADTKYVRARWDKKERSKIQRGKRLVMRNSENKKIQDLENENVASMVR